MKYQAFCVKNVSQKNYLTCRQSISCIQFVLLWWYFSHRFVQQIKTNKNVSKYFTIEMFFFFVWKHNIRIKMIILLFLILINTLFILFVFIKMFFGCIANYNTNFEGDLKWTFFQIVWYVPPFIKRRNIDANYFNDFLILWFL